MKKPFLSITLLIFIQHLSFSQDQHTIDSLQTVLKTAKKDTSRANILYQLSRAYLGNNPEKAMDYAKQSLDLAKQIGYKKGMGNAYNNMGIVNNDKGDYLPALDFFKKSLKIREEINDKKGIAGSYNGIGLLYYRQGNYPEALRNYFAALKIREEIGDKYGIVSSYINIGNLYYNQSNYPEALKYLLISLDIAQKLGYKVGITNSYNNIGNIYYSQGKYPEALKNYFSALKMYENIGDKQGMAALYNNIGVISMIQENFPEALKNCSAALKNYEEIGDKRGIASSYINLGNIYSDQNNETEALKSYFASLEIYEEIGDQYGIAYSWCDIGCTYMNQRNYSKAMEYYLKALKILKEMGDNDGIAGAYINIGEIYSRQKKFNNASQYLNMALSLAKETGTLQNIISSYKSLASLDSATGNFRRALEHYKLYIAARDSSFNEENTRKSVQQQMQYEFDKKEALAKTEQKTKDALAMKEMQRQKLLRNGFVGGFAIVLFFAGILYIQRNKIRKGKKRSDELLLNILPSEVAEELKAKGSATPKQFDEATIMFTDFKDFTRISEKLTPAELVAEIDACYKAFDSIIAKHNTEKIKTIGDSYMCAGGLPVPNKTSAFDVINAAIEINDFMLRRKEENNNPVYEIRIGIHTGPVVAGIVGSKKFAYDIWGDTVNIASRMESSGEAGQVNISGTTYALVKDKFSCRHRGKIMAKNKGEIDMYFVEKYD